MAYQYFAGYGLPCVRVRPGNQIGPRQAAGFVAADFARAIAEAEAGIRKPTIPVGNLDAERDFTDVRDMVVAYELALRLGIPGDVYNIGSGSVIPIHRVLNVCLSFSKAPLEVEVDRNVMRPRDPSIVAADVTKFRKLSGWRPNITLEQSLEDTLNYWRKRTASSTAMSSGVTGDR
jgi:GDP-4-dehydro-6-deoxy-D-mannose reductase